MIKENQQQILTVTQVAAFCEVNRNAVGLWIRSRKLHAERKGRNHSIPVSGSIFFLKSTGLEILVQVVAGADLAPHFRTIQKCWKPFSPMKLGILDALC